MKITTLISLIIILGILPVNFSYGQSGGKPPEKTENFEAQPRNDQERDMIKENGYLKKQWTAGVGMPAPKGKIDIMNGKVQAGDKTCPVVKDPSDKRPAITFYKTADGKIKKKCRDDKKKDDKQGGGQGGKQDGKQGGKQDGKGDGKGGGQGGGQGGGEEKKGGGEQGGGGSPPQMPQIPQAQPKEEQPKDNSNQQVADNGNQIWEAQKADREQEKQSGEDNKGMERFTNSKTDDTNRQNNTNQQRRRSNTPASDSWNPMPWDRGREKSMSSRNPYNDIEPLQQHVTQPGTFYNHNTQSSSGNRDFDLNYSDNYDARPPTSRRVYGTVADGTRRFVRHVTTNVSRGFNRVRKWFM